MEAKQLDMINASKIISGELDIRDHVDYKVNKITWPTFMMLTDDKGLREFQDTIEACCYTSISRKNNEIQALVKARLAAELEKQATTLKEMPGGYRYLNEKEAEKAEKKQLRLGEKKEKTRVFGGQAAGSRAGSKPRSRSSSRPGSAAPVPIAAGWDGVEVKTRASVKVSSVTLDVPEALVTKK